MPTAHNQDVRGASKDLGFSGVNFEVYSKL